MMKTSPTPSRPSRKSVVKAKAAPPEPPIRARRAVAKRTTAPSTRTRATRPTPSVDEVRVRAFEIFLSRNGSGDELSDWLRAEQELMEGQ